MDFPQLYPRPKSLGVADSAMCPPYSLQSIHDPDLAPQEFCLIGKGNCCELRSSDAAGRCYGLKAWEQIQACGPPPEFELRDAPDFPTRGLMLDVSRCKVPTMDSLLELLPLLADLRYNQLQLYIEHTFAFADHEVVWKEASPFTAGEIRQLAAACAEANGLFIRPSGDTIVMAPPLIITLDEINEMFRRFRLALDGILEGSQK